MARRHVRARNAKSARRKASGPRTTVTKVNYLPGSLKKGLKTFDVTTKKRKSKK